MKEEDVRMLHREGIGMGLTRGEDGVHGGSFDRIWGRRSHRRLPVSESCNGVRGNGEEVQEHIWTQ